MKYVLEIECPGDSFLTEPGESAPHVAAGVVSLLADGGGMDGVWTKSEDGTVISARVHDGVGAPVGWVRWIQS